MSTKLSTRNRINEKLEKIKAIRFVDYKLEPIFVNVKSKEIKSFRILLLNDTEKVKENIKEARRTDGLWTIVTNICSKEDDLKGFTAAELISSYRDKNQIEEAFKNVKSFINVQPFHVWTSTHVRAHYTICVLSYLLNITVINILRKGDTDIKSQQTVYDILKKGIVGKISIKNASDDNLKLILLKPDQEKILKLFQNEGIIEKKYLKSMNINYS
ncbi:MAG: hypothetical protein GW779_03880 [Candidatus Altiarchaeum hamiconexum]|uniref:Transposase IS4-like domain-containing protein n=1 Tax=Candidatus Altarchaeum hamiconexum TaxID=1803513 RepID=A0A8J8CIG2_9ARCH|nr:hypothetical protein [Candidatus Altarchaeum hamiconexum]NCN69483.1 hypothetical protein [Candidatus Altarchaeum hamiconexum]NCS91534.1 hypothetical protein [Candidatus Altarchaeum hamiconexum]OIQ06095.1 MAG: hypothetical protein AUK59_01125 [Candidatus Altarchaeum sp. CG2_30_32_3053]